MDMEKTIELNNPLSSLPKRYGREVRYTLKRSRRARGVRLSVACGGVFTVTAPPRMRESRIEEFIHRKSEWVLDKIKYFSKFPRRTFIKNRKRHFAEHKAKTAALVAERLAHFNQLYGFKWNRVAIQNQRSRWGSCSHTRNLNFNYKLALLPPHLCDYIIVHELCHLGELNHSAKFWTLVARNPAGASEFAKGIEKYEHCIELNAAPPTEIGVPSESRRMSRPLGQEASMQTALMYTHCYTQYTYKLEFVGVI